MERRGHKRHSGKGLKCNMVLCPEVKLCDISLGGALVEAARRINIGSKCVLELRKKSKALKISSVVTRSVISGSRSRSGGEFIPVYQAALEFRGLTGEKSMALLDIIREVSTGDRFEDLQFIVQSQTVPGRPFNYRVMDVGLEGIQVESDMEFRVNDDVTLEIYVEEHLPVEFTGRVTSCRRIKGDGPLYKVSFAFTDMNEERKADIIRYIDSVS